jgi:hypothetical protein
VPQGNQPIVRLLGQLQHPVPVLYQTESVLQVRFGRRYVTD